MSKSLSIIQNLAKAGKIVSKVMFVIGIIGIVCCIIGTVVFSVIPEDKFDLAGVDLSDILGESFGINFMHIVAVLASATVSGVSITVLAKISENFFSYELSIGTPFDFEVCDRMKKFGIQIIIISVAADIFSSITYTVLSNIFKFSEKANATDISGAIVTGIAFLLLSVICRYGAEVRNETK